MKKNFLLFSLLVFGIVFSAFAKKVEIRSAQLAAKNFYYERVNQKQAVSYQSISINGQYISQVNGEPVYYVLSVANGGFVIVSADDAVTPIIGYSTSETFVADNQPENYVSWMEHYRDQITFVRQNDIQPTSEITAAWNHLLTNDPSNLTIYRSTTDVAPLLLTMNWDQTFPYNAMCPADPAGPDGHCVVGCVATAMAQIMCYWRWPNTGTGYHCVFPQPSYGPQCADFANTTYDWNGVANTPGKEADPVALISWHAGIGVDMDYGPDASSSYMSRVAPAYINYFQYATTTSVVNRYSNLDQWITLLKGDLDLGQPLQYAGSSTQSGGHSWVCDGYQGTDQFHMNWGWSGYANGYFTLNNLNPAGENFNSNQSACVHIKPDNMQYPGYCSGAQSLTTYDFGMIEDGSGPVANYQGGANCSWLINIDDSVKNVTLSFDRFALNATDYVKVYDGIDAAAPLLGSFTGTSLPAAVTTTGSKMFITFTSAAGSTANGFLASYSTNLENFCTNNNVLTATEGNIGDGSGRFMYRNGSSCRWTIQPPDAATITLTFNSFSTEQDKDVLKVFDKENLGTPLATLSGQYSTPPDAITSPSGGMMILFSSNKSIRDLGWDGSYSITVGTGEPKAFDQLEVFPNPTDGLLNINFTVSEQQNVKIELISLQGSTVYSEALNKFKGTFSKQMDLTAVSKGVYMLRMTSDKGISNKKIIVQ